MADRPRLRSARRGNPASAGGRRASATAEWIEWAAQNLALGVPKEKLKGEMVRSGITATEAVRLLNEIIDNPVFAAAKRLAGEVRKWTSLNDALLALESQVVDFSRIPRVSGLSSDEFLHDYYTRNRPVIIEDVVERWPAVSKWSLDFLRENFGTQEVTFQQGRSADDHRDSFIDHSVTGTLRTFIDLIECETQTNSHYLIAHDRLLDQPGFKPLLQDVIFDDRYFAPDKSDERVFFWLGPAGTMTPMHRDLGNVYLAQIKGRKSIKMIPSRHMHLVYNESGYHSEVDFDDFSYRDYPLLKKAWVMEDVIEPGELLFIPLGWWHHVKALDLSITVTGNNFRFANAFTPIF